MPIKLATDPVGAWDELQEYLKKYVTSAFGTNSETFEVDRKALLDTSGVFFQDPYLELLPEYTLEESLLNLDADDLPGLTSEARDAFCKLASVALVPGEFKLFKHQQDMLREGLNGKHSVVVTGTGSGKTESFLLPVLAGIVREAKSKHWSKPSRLGPRWGSDNLPKWNDRRSALRGETRSPAVRALLLYPMNALVEDQISRLRAAIDSDAAHAVMDEVLDGNRIRFGRYNGSTPVSGHPFDLSQEGRERKTPKHGELRNSFKGAFSQFEELAVLLSSARQELIRHRKTGNEEDIRAAEDKLEKLEEQSTFSPRMGVDSCEMFHRWEMQDCPPDILISNVSMLSIMLMRNRHPDISQDRADSMIFDQTRSWLKEDEENHVFHLVIDELHLYRGASGTEVAYLLRQLLDRLGLEPTSKQLRIFASSASLDGDSEATYEFLGGMFGLTSCEARKRFHVEAGELLYSVDLALIHI